jgi:hypothetical protein
MATVTAEVIHAETATADDVWERSFTAEDRQHLLDEDTEAFAGVTGILMFLVSAGLVLGVLSLLIVFALGLG